jgi:hypothetical protein
MIVVVVDANDEIADDFKSNVLVGRVVAAPAPLLFFAPAPPAAAAIVVVATGAFGSSSTVT